MLDWKNGDRPESLDEYHRGTTFNLYLLFAPLRLCALSDFPASEGAAPNTPGMNVTSRPTSGRKIRDTL